MNQASNSKQNDDGVLRAGDILPPYKVQPARTSGGSIEQREKHDIPRFNLAEEIMAEQRKFTSAKRKAPGPKNVTASLQEKVIESIRNVIPSAVEGHAVIPPTPLLLDQQQVITEIVARDIMQMSRDFSFGSAQRH
jgi:hypothetical protein